MRSTTRLMIAGLVLVGTLTFWFVRFGTAESPKPQAEPQAAEAEKQQPEKPQAERQPAKEPAAKGPAAKFDLPPGRVIFQQSDAERSVREALGQSAELEFIDTQLGDIVTHLQLLHKIPIRIDLPALAADGKGSDTAFTTAIRGATLRTALRSMLKAEQLTFAVADDHLVITTEAGASSYLQTRVYQVHDLVVAANDPTAEVPLFKELIDLIECSILPETWMIAGGLEGSINAFEAPGVMALVIRHTEVGHELVEQLLTNLRLANDRKVAEMQRHRQTPPQNPTYQEPVVVGGVVAGEEPAPTPAMGQGGRFF